MNLNTVLPANGVGYVTNNRGPSGKFQFGEKSPIDVAVVVATAWDAPNYASLIGSIGLFSSCPRILDDLRKFVFGSCSCKPSHWIITGDASNKSANTMS